MKGNLLLDTLSKIEKDEIDILPIWNDLPNVAGGAEWKKEIQDCASSIKDSLVIGGDYEEDTMAELSAEYADCNITYHSNTHEKVHALNLWASDEIEQELKELGDKSHSMMYLEGMYLYIAYNMIWRTVISFIFEENY